MVAVAADKLFWAASRAMAKVFLLSLTGALFAKYPRQLPVLSRAAQRTLAQVSTFIVMPASLIYGLGSSISVEKLAEVGMLLGWSVAHTFLSLTLAHLMFSLCLGSVGSGFRRVLTAASTFHNAVSLPLLMVSSLCEQPALREVESCTERALANCFIYLLPWQIMFWSGGYVVFASQSDTSAGGFAQVEQTTLEVTHEEVSLDRPITGDNDCDTEKLPSTPPTSGLSTGGNFFRECCNRDSLYKIVANPCMMAIPIGVGCGLVSPLRKSLFEEGGSVLQPVGSTLKTLTDPLIAINTVVMAASLFPDEESDSLAGDCDWRLVITFCLTRLVVIPVCGVIMVYLVKSLCPFMVGDTLMQLVILVEFGSPSAQSVIIVCQAAGSQKMAGKLAFLFMWQHLFAMISLTAVTTLALFVVVDE